MNEALLKIARRILLMPRVKQEFRKVRAFYNKRAHIDDAEWLDIKEAFMEGDTKALEKLVQMVRRENLMIVEVGSWKGYSTAILGRSVIDCHGSVFAVDHWMGSKGAWNYDVAREQDIYSIFKENMIALRLWDVVHPLVMDSETAAKIFAEGILDLVFIDADHRYEYVSKDISYWLPKLRESGIICGHDCEGYYSKFSDEIRKMIDERLVGQGEYIWNVCHHGVVRALYDHFQDKYSIMPNSTIWYYVKTGAGSNV